ncbi:MAG: asparagine synthase (glutamine-hydrolyzing) [Nitrospinae bacterium CG11_big_fil_rev_8_21_14_0_20_56_8]|nr:MAG: asparagine synthase (glutamine-hydrolyzing) [Nitrospinae bacterium CG11_big_fil_rev_8_21_14_0_20_56_8]
MCGLAGFLIPGASEPHWPQALERMGDALNHRGPDDRGMWLDPACGLGMVHRRLSILDLSEKGRQPMFSLSRRYVVVYNGEIFNFRELRKELSATAPHAFQSQSDTEVLLACVEQWGLKEAVGRLIGMFAFALWDRRENILHLVRDRLGIKPLYYGSVKGGLAFASELKALKHMPGFQKAIDRSSVSRLLRYGYIPAPYCIYKNVYKLPPGTILSVPRNSDGDLPSPVPFWSLRQAFETGLHKPFQGSSEDAADELEARLRESVRLRLISDVGLGAFLSGGTDSSLVVSLMQKQMNRPAKTFCVGFDNPHFDESTYAREVAQRLGCDHINLKVTAKMALDSIPRLPEIYDEPFADASQIPTFLVSKLTRGHVTVALSGDGGDELFGGYSRYGQTRSIWNTLHGWPGSLRSVLASLLRMTPPGIFPDPKTPYRLRKLAEICTFANEDSLYEGMVSYWDSPDSVVLDGNGDPDLFQSRRPLPEGLDDFRRMMYLDTLTYLPDDILTKVDRASMAVGLEVRVPLLDHRVVEFLWRLPHSLHVDETSPKLLLRKVLARHIDPALFDRPKKGFSLPLSDWLRGPLREWAESLLNEDRLRREGFFDPSPIRYRWREHLQGKCDWKYHLWNVLMFQAWLERHSG